MHNANWGKYVFFHYCLNASLAFSIAVLVHLHAYCPCALKKNFTGWRREPIDFVQELHGEWRKKRWLVDKDMTCKLRFVCSTMSMITVISKYTCMMGKMPILTETRPDTRLPKSRAGRQGPYFGSLYHLGRSSEAKDRKNPKK